MFRVIVLVFLCSWSLSYAVDCKNPMTTYDMRECASLDFEKADKKLNTAYNKLRKMQDKIGKQKLKDAQKAWIKYRDAKAVFDADAFRGGTAEPLLYTSSLTQTTKNRAKELKSDLQMLKETR
jgi:uncharacterized protein YecT (DUF1311 family)